MDSFAKILENHESWLTERILSYTKGSGRLRSSSVTDETWRSRIAHLSASLAKAICSAAYTRQSVPDPLMDFVILEVQSHRNQGISLGMSLGLLKHYREAYLDLLHHLDLDGSTHSEYQQAVHRCFDRVEIGFGDTWDALRIEPREVGEARAVPEEVIVESKLLMQSALDVLPQQIAILDESGAIVFANKAWRDGGPLAARGVEGSDFLSPCEGMGSKGLSPASDMRRAISDMLSGNLPSFSAEYLYQAPGAQHERWISATARLFPLFGARRVLVSFADITARKGAQRDLERKNQFLTTVLESLTHPFMVINADDLTVSLSNSACGIPPSRDRPKCHEVSHGRPQPCDPADNLCPVDIVKRTGKATLLEHRHRTSTNDEGFVEVHAYPVFDKDRNVTQVIEYSVDITTRKMAEEAQRDSEQKLDGIIGSMTDHLIVIDDGFRIEWANDVAKSLFGSDIVGKKCHQVLCNELLQCELCAIADCVADGNPHDREKTIERPDGNTVHLWCTASVATRYDDGRPKTYVQILRDVTELKRTQELLLETEGLRAVSELTSGVAHNFRNLLQVIVSAARLASMEMQDNNLEEADIALEQILRVSNFGAGTIKRMEEFARPSDELPERPDEVFDLSLTVSQAIEMSKPWWKSKPQRQGATVRVRHDLENGAWVKGQESKLFEVIVNLLRNAVEALPGDGTITLKTSVRQPVVLLTMRDNGPGIAPNSIQNVFDPFWTTKYGRRSGVGLATARKIITKHQGSISVESLLGRGSTFTISLPLAAVGKKRKVHDKEQPPLSILVIDDIDQAATFLRKALQRAGHSVVSSLSGEEALALFKNSTVDAVLCDLCMPEMNGLDVGKRIKDICLARGVDKPVFILITGWADQKLQPEEVAESGIDGVLEKPADLESIQNLVIKLVEQKKQQ